MIDNTCFNWSSIALAGRAGFNIKPSALQHLWNSQKNLKSGELFVIHGTTYEVPMYWALKFNLPLNNFCGIYLNSECWIDEKLCCIKLNWTVRSISGFTCFSILFSGQTDIVLQNAKISTSVIQKSYLMSKVALVPLIMSPGPTGPALSEETAACKPGYNSLPERKHKLLFVVCLLYVWKVQIPGKYRKIKKHKLKKLFESWLNSVGPLVYSVLY